MHLTETNSNAQIPPRADGEEQFAETQQILLTTAERLFAERGVRMVSEQQISETAGQQDNTAVRDHFGSKEQLVHAIVEHHEISISHIRKRRVQHVRDAADLREWIAVAVWSLTEYLETLGSPSWYARFIVQVIAAPTLAGQDAGERGAEPWLQNFQNNMRRCLPDLPVDVQEARTAMTSHLIMQSTVDRERALVENPAEVTNSWTAFAANLIDAIVAIWQAPVTTGPSSEADIQKSSTETANAARVEFIRRLRDDFERLMMEYRFGVDEILTNVNILRQEFLHLHRYNPIEHVTSRVKPPQSILEKALRRGLEMSLPAIRENITDIAGIRITCSFIADTYRVLENLTSQDDIRILEVKDYIHEPKANGYKSLHVIVEIPVFLSTGAVPVVVEIQIRTIAMDFWASLEHKIFYKYEGAVPERVLADLKDAATAADTLDYRMEQLHTEVRELASHRDEESKKVDIDEAVLRRLWDLQAKTS